MRVSGLGSVARLVAVPLACAACGAGAADPAGAACTEAAAATRAPGIARQGITLGGTISLLGLSPSEQNAIVLLETSDTSSDVVALCSGVLVADGTVLTARHCFDGFAEPRARVQFGSEELAPLFETDASRISLHPGADLAVLTLAQRPERSLAAPIPIPREPATLLGMEVGEIAGFGVTEELSFGRRLFAAVEVRSTGEYFEATAAPLSGACIGDSGGPLLARDEHGSASVLGVLSHGSASCRGLDRYVRADASDEFLALLPAGDASVGACGSLGQAGACFSGTAVWCDGEIEARTTCEDGTACGWDLDVSGFRCVKPELDPCGGTTSFGTCAGGVARRCDAGQLREEDCAACGQSCVRDPTSARVGCR
jgi:hypothetical protein